MIVQPRMTTSAWSSWSASRQAAAASSATAVVSSIMSVTYQSMQRTPRQLPAPWIRTRSSSHGRALAMVGDDRERVPEVRGVVHRRLERTDDRDVDQLAGDADPGVVAAADDDRVVAALLELAHLVEDRQSPSGASGSSSRCWPGTPSRWMTSTEVPRRGVRHERLLDDRVEGCGAERVDERDPALHGGLHRYQTLAPAVGTRPARSARNGVRSMHRLGRRRSGRRQVGRSSVRRRSRRRGPPR